MSKRDEYEKKTEQLLQGLLEKPFELVDVEYVKEGGNNFLRVYADKEGGININDCEAISRKLSDLLDQHDYIDESYILEVSSPGLGRQMKKEKDFNRSIGQEVDVKLFKAVNKVKDYTGILLSHNEDSVELKLDNEKVMTIKKSEMAMIRLTVHF